MVLFSHEKSEKFEKSNDFNANSFLDHRKKNHNKQDVVRTIKQNMNPYCSGSR